MPIGSLADLIRSCRDPVTARHLHDHVVSLEQVGSSTVTFLLNLLVDSYGRAGCPQEAETVFRSIRHPNAHSWNTLAAAFARCGHVQEAAEVLWWMPAKDSVSWNTLISVTGRIGPLELAESCFTKAPLHSTAACTTMTTVYAEHGQPGQARATFDAMQGRNVVAWTSLVQAYATNERYLEARDALDRMPATNAVSWTAAFPAFTVAAGICLDETFRFFHDRVWERDVVSWTAMAQACVDAGCLDDAGVLVRLMPRRGVASWNLMVNAFAQRGRVAEAKATFDQMPHRDVVSWNALLHGYVVAVGQERLDHREAATVLRLVPSRDVVSSTLLLLLLHGSPSAFDEMPQRNLVSWNATVEAMVRRGRVAEAGECFNKMPSHDAASVVTIVAALTTTGHLEQARWVFDRMPKTSATVAAWTSMLAGYARNGCVRQALELLGLMSLEGVQPNEVSFAACLMGYNHVGRLDDARQCFVTMAQEHGLSPGPRHYTLLVDMLGRSKRLPEAEELIGNMPFSPHQVAWSSLLAARGDLETGPVSVDQPVDDGWDARAAAMYAHLSRAAAAAASDVAVKVSI